MNPRLAVFTKNHSNPAYAAARLGAERTARRLGASVAHFVPDVPDDIDQQRALIRSALEGAFDAAVLVPVHETAVNDAVALIEAAGLPLFTFVTPVTVGRPLTFVGSDDIALGEAIALRLFKRLGGRGRIVIIEGTPASATSRDRMTGFQAALSACPAIQVAACVRGDYQRDIARVAFAALASDVRRADGVLCANDVMALGVLDHLQDNVQSAAAPLIVGVNAIPEAIAAIRAGRMLATAAFDAMSMCAVATESAIRHLRGEVVPARIMLPVEIVDQSTAASWDRPFAERELAAWGGHVVTP